jgi:hypothetical protein
MTPTVTSRFCLERHQGPYETWPLRSRLLDEGRPTRLSLPGYDLIRQYQIDAGYLLVTDYDCPFEESTNFLLLSDDLHPLSRRRLGAPYASLSLEAIEWLDEQRFVAIMHGGHRWLGAIRPWGIPFLLPRLRLKWIRRGVVR